MGADKDWKIYYVDQHREKRIKSFPNGAYHRGGAQLFNRVDNFTEGSGNES